MRHTHRLDANHRSLRRVAEQVGWLWLDCAQTGLGVDALLIKGGRIVVAEIKDGQKPMSQQKLTPHEKLVHARLKAHGITVEILTSEADVIAMERPHRRGSYDDRQIWGGVRMDLPREMSMLAEWWCAVNGHCSPPGRPGLSEIACDALYDHLSSLPGVEMAGLALWRKRVDAGLYPQNGHPRTA